MFVCMCVCMHVYVCMYVCLYACVCLYVCYATLTCFAYRAPIFQEFIYDYTVRSWQFNFVKIPSVVTLSMNNQITLCSYYVQLFTMACVFSSIVINLCNTKHC